MTTSTTRITQVVKRNGLQVRASFLASLAVLFLSCQTSSRLPQEEAPAEIATGLAILPNTVLLATAKSVVAGKPSQPGTPDGSGVALPAISCSVTKAWWVQIFYPITVCYPPDFINGVESVYEAADDQPSIQLQRSAFREYRLSSFAGKRLHRPMWCRRHSGPWVAAITENIDCSNNSHFELTILGIGSNVHYSWWGALEDVPSEISVVGEFNLKGSYRTPCGSLSTCN